MSFLTVDQTKCKRDRICAAECPARLIVFRELDAFPSSVKRAEQFCLRCGHCVAVCPHQAISVKTVNSVDCVPVDPGLLPAPAQVEHLLKSRRSIRSFKDKSVDRAILEKLIDVSAYAPSGHNMQPVHWLVVADKHQVRHIAGLVVDWMRYIIEHMPQIAAVMHMEAVCYAWDKGIDTICRNAPHLIIAHAPEDTHVSQGSCTIALTYLELAAYSMGVGACWAGFVGAAAETFPPLMQELALPEGHKAFGAMLIGYPKYQYHRIPPRTAPRIIWR